MDYNFMERNSFWNKLSELYYDYEVTDIDTYIILDMNGGLEITLAISSIIIGGDIITGLLDDGTEIMVAIDEINTLRHNPDWIVDDDFQDGVALID